MPVFKGARAEDDLVETLVANIEKDWAHVYSGVNLASYNFKEYWQKWFKGRGYPPAQPEIDLILVDSSYDLSAVEVKYFRMAISRITPSSYYKGIEEALALLRMGFSYVNLWHFFDEGVPLDLINSYVEAASNLVSTLDVPIGYKAFYVKGVSGRGVFFDLSSRSSDNKPYVSNDPVKPRLMWKTNPLRKSDYAKKIDDFLRHALRIPKSDHT